MISILAHIFAKHSRPVNGCPCDKMKFGSLNKKTEQTLSTGLDHSGVISDFRNHPFDLVFEVMFLDVSVK